MKHTRKKLIPLNSKERQNVIESVLEILKLQKKIKHSTLRLSLNGILVKDTTRIINELPDDVYLKNSHIFIPYIFKSLQSLLGTPLKRIFPDLKDNTDILNRTLLIIKLTYDYKTKYSLMTGHGLSYKQQKKVEKIIRQINYFWITGMIPKETKFVTMHELNQYDFSYERAYTSIQTYFVPIQGVNYGINEEPIETVVGSNLLKLYPSTDLVKNRPNKLMYLKAVLISLHEAPFPTVEEIAAFEHSNSLTSTMRDFFRLFDIWSCTPPNEETIKYLLNDEIIKRYMTEFILKSEATLRNTYSCLKSMYEFMTLYIYYHDIEIKAYYSELVPEELYLCVSPDFPFKDNNVIRSKFISKTSFILNNFHYLLNDKTIIRLSTIFGVLLPYKKDRRGSEFSITLKHELDLSLLDKFFCNLLVVSSERRHSEFYFENEAFAFEYIKEIFPNHLKFDLPRYKTLIKYKFNGGD